jgi:hypothetical protein
MSSEPARSTTDVQNPIRRRNRRAIYIAFRFRRTPHQPANELYSLEKDARWASKSVVAQKKLFLNAAYLLREMTISSENCGSLRRLLSSGSVVK